MALVSVLLRNKALGIGLVSKTINSPPQLGFFVQIPLKTLGNLGPLSDGLDVIHLFSSPSRLGRIFFLGLMSLLLPSLTF